MQIKLDHREQDPDQSLGSFEQPKPGLYKVVVDSPTVRFSGEGTDKNLRDIEVIAKVLDDKNYAGARVWDYVSFSTAAIWKMDQFMLAMGLMTRSKRTKVFKSEKELERALKGTKAMIRVKGRSTDDGEYRADVAQWMPLADEDDEDEEFLDVDESEEDLEDEVDEVDEVDEDEGEVDEDEGEDAGSEDEEEYTAEEISAMRIADLRQLAEYLDISHAGVKKSDLRDLVLDELGLAEEAPF